MKFAFIILDHFESSVDRAEIHNGDARIIGVVCRLMCDRR